MPKISIIIPVYNAAPYLEECLLSISQQTFTDFEIWAINVGSTDRSLEILKKYQEKEPRLKVFSQVNKGVSAARNLGLDNAKGEYIAFVDADDWLPDFMVKIENLILQNKYHIIIGGFLAIAKNGIVINRNTINYINKEEIIADFISWKLKIRLGSFLIKREILLKNKIVFNTNYKYAEDVDVITRCLYFADKTIVIDEIFYHYLIQENSAISIVNFNRFHSYIAKNNLYLFFKKRENFKKVEKIYVGYQLPEAIIDVVEMLCQKRVNISTTIKYLQENNYYQVLEEKRLNEFTPIHIKEKIRRFKKNPYYFCIKTNIDFLVSHLKSKVYKLIYKP